MEDCSVKQGLRLLLFTHHQSEVERSRILSDTATHLTFKSFVHTVTQHESLCTGRDLKAPYAAHFQTLIFHPGLQRSGLTP